MKKEKYLVHSVHNGVNFDAGSNETAKPMGRAVGKVENFV